ncbi:MAG: Pr6Pr family membrane protein [Clostridia bacterium]|nr:Pr6Pr family membrane protein [Clostridia bacterium]
MTVNMLVDIILSVAVSAIGIIGVTFNCSIIKRGIRGEIFIYYTNLSNLAVILYHLLLLISYTDTESVFHRLIAASPIRLSVTLMIMLTFAIYHFVLRPICKKFHRGFYSEDAPKVTADKAIGNICVHYIVPILVFAEWIFSADKSGLRITDGIIWILCPATYMLFIAVRGYLIDKKTKKSNSDNNGKTPVKYPYPFIDIDMLGGARVALNVAIIAAVCAAVGCTTAWFSIFLSA